MPRPIAAAIVARLGLALGVGVLALLGISCGNSQVTYTLQFPDNPTFFASSTAEASLYDATSDIELCRKLISGEDPGSPALNDPSFVDVCQFEAGTVALTDLGPGVRALYVQVKGMGDKIILQGCQTFDLFQGQTDIVINLAVTPDYAANAIVSTCQSVDDKCSGTCN